MPDANAPEATGEPDGALDLAAVVAEIEAEARARRRSGRYPPAFERELGELFARFAPPEASGDLGALIDAAEEHGLIEPFIPVESQKPAGRIVKQGFARALGWYHTWLTQEISQFAGSSVRALRVVADRLAAIERRLGDADARDLELAGLAPVAPAPAIIELVRRRLAGVTGRVVVARAGRGQLVVALRADGVDVYGTEPDAATRDAADDEFGISLLPDEPYAHLGSVGRGALAAAVLLGSDVDAAPAGSRIALLRRAITRIRDEGVLLVVATERDAYPEREPIAADLAAAPPFGAPTWEHLLVAAGLDDITVEAGERQLLITARRRG